MQKEISGTIIYDKDGNPIGIATNSATLDYAEKNELQRTVLVIRPKKKEEK